MKILILECTAEELRANRTVIDCLTDALNKFTDSLCGVRLNPEEAAAVLSNFGEEADNPDQE